jgi:predicted RNA-binding Zn-ribbon protein involved in translation (DUF1610 family)
MNDPVRAALQEILACSMCDPNGKKPWASAGKWLTVNVPTDVMERARAALAGGVEQQPTVLNVSRHATANYDGTMTYATRPPEDAAPARLEQRPCAKGCQYAKDAGMPDMHCADERGCRMEPEPTARLEGGNDAAAHVAAEPMILPCPNCGAKHIDRNEWATKPHRTHRCEICAHEWRPANVPTVGVNDLRDAAACDPPAAVEQVPSVTPAGPHEPESAVHFDRIGSVPMSLPKPPWLAERQPNEPEQK